MVTTAIVYPNNRMHIGFAWECLGADFHVRALRMFGYDTFFTTGMDEHAIKVQKAAEAKGLTPQAHCDELAQDIEKVLRSIGLSHDRFIRTSDPDHERVVQSLVQKAFDRGDIYSSRYEGHYCEGCEAYYTEKDLIEGLCPTHKTQPRWISEENYFFRLSKYQDKLLEHFKKHPEFLQPEFRKAEILNFIEAGLKDFSISRSNFTWGIPLPFDPKHVIYVWFDALINYVTAAGYEWKLKDPRSKEAQLFDQRWPASVHVIGKDITRFHTIYWPAMLMSLDLPLPERVFAHGFLNLKGERMSKSSGNMMTPDEVIAVTGPDPFRYYLLAENQFSQDGNFSLEALILKCNADLANDWGNLVNRTISMTRKYFPEQKLSVPNAQKLSSQVHSEFVSSFIAELEKTAEALDTAGYISLCGAKSRLLNLFIDQTKPWKLAKEIETRPEAKEELAEVLYTLLEGIRWVATAFLPVLPFRMPEVFRQLGVEVPPEKGAFQRLNWGEKTYQPGEPSPIYPRIEVEKPVSG